MSESWFSRTFDALQYRQYRILWLGTLFAFLTFQMSRTAQGIVAFDLEGTNQAVGLVAIGQGISNAGRARRRQPGRHGARRAVVPRAGQPRSADGAQRTKEIRHDLRATAL